MIYLYIIKENNITNKTEMKTEKLICIYSGEMSCAKTGPQIGFPLRFRSLYKPGVVE
jgi:hypothetical protein